VVAAVTMCQVAVIPTVGAADTARQKTDSLIGFCDRIRC